MGSVDVSVSNARTHCGHRLCARRRRGGLGCSSGFVTSARSATCTTSFMGLFLPVVLFEFVGVSATGMGEIVAKHRQTSE